MFELSFLYIVFFWSNSKKEYSERRGEDEENLFSDDCVSVGFSGESLCLQ